MCNGVEPLGSSRFPRRVPCWLSAAAPPHAGAPGIGCQAAGPKAAAATEAGVIQH